MSQSKTLKKEKLTFNTIWQKYGTFGILIILLAILAILKTNILFLKLYGTSDFGTEFGKYTYCNG